jgi:hypothetical protein
MSVNFCFNSFDLLSIIAEYFDAKTVSCAAQVNKLFHSVTQQDCVWERLCLAYGFKSLTSVTKTRGKRSFKNIFQSSLCVECRGTGKGKGMVVIDVNGGSRFNGTHRVGNPTTSLLTLCSDCFYTVQQYQSMSARLSGALERSKKVLEYSTWSTLLTKIPFVSSKKEKRVSSSLQYDDPTHNNHLLRLLKKAKR